MSHISEYIEKSDTEMAKQLHKQVFDEMFAKAKANFPQVNDETLRTYIQNMMKTAVKNATTAIAERQTPGEEQNERENRIVQKLKDAAE
jgi:spore coat protein CotF